MGPQGRSPVPRVRAAEAPDARAIARVHTDSWRETYAGVFEERYFSEESCHRRAEMWARVLADPSEGASCMVATLPATRAGSGERIIGFGNAGPAVGPHAEMGHTPARQVHLFTLYALASAHGTGAGQGLLDALIGKAPAQLWVLRGNDRAIAFYRRNGFAFDGAEASDSTNPEIVELRMVR